MVFTVISIAPGLTLTDHKRAVNAGPPFVESALDYPTLLRQTRWKITERIDLTREYAQTYRRLLRVEQAHADKLSEFFGPAEFSKRMVGRRATIEIIEGGLLRRELFVVDVGPADEPENVDDD